MIRPKERGMTLIEVMIATTIFAAIGLAAASILSVGVQTYRIFDSKATASRSGSLGLDFLHEDVLASTSMTNLCTGPVVSFSLAKYNGLTLDTETVLYHWSGTPGDPITRSVDGGSTVEVLENVDTFDLRFLFGTRPTQRLDDESIPLTAFSTEPVFTLDYLRDNYGGALATSPGADSQIGVITLANSGYALATQGGSGAASESGPYSASEITYRWNAPQDTDEATGVALYLRKATTTGSFTDPLNNLDAFTETGGQTGKWSAANDGDDGMSGQVLFPNSLRANVGEPSDVLVRTGTDRYRAFSASMTLWAFNYAATTIFADDLQTNFLNWLETPNGGYFVRSDAGNDGAMNEAIISQPSNTIIDYLVANVAGAANWADRKVSFNLWMPAGTEDNIPDSREIETKFTYINSFDTDLVLFVPSGWRYAGTLQEEADFHVKLDLLLDLGIHDDTHTGNGIDYRYPDPAGWADTISLLFQADVAADGQEIYVVLASDTELYAATDDGKCPAGAIVIGMKTNGILPTSKVVLQAYLGRGSGSSLQAVGAPITVNSWSADGTSKAVQFDFHAGKLKMYVGGALVGVITGFTAEAPRSANYFGFLNKKGSTPVDKWFISSVDLKITRGVPKMGGILEPSAIFSDDFEDLSSTGLSLPSSKGWFHAFAETTYYDIQSNGTTKVLGFTTTGGEATHAPMYYNIPTWNSSGLDTFAVELDLYGINSVGDNVSIILASPDFLPGTGQLSRNTLGVRMMRIRKNSNMTSFTPAWGTGAGVATSSTYDATHTGGTTVRFRMEMRGATLLLYRNSVLVATWDGVFPDAVISTAAGIDGSDPGQKFSIEAIRAYHSACPGGAQVGHVYLLTRYKDALNHYRVRLYRDSGDVWARSEEMTNGVLIRLGAVKKIATAGAVQSLSYQLEGESLSVVGGLGTLTSTHTRQLIFGTSGFASGDGEAHYDNIDVKATRGQADILVRYRSDSDYLALRILANENKANLQIIKCLSGTESLVWEAANAFNTQAEIPLEIKMLATDSLSIRVDTGLGLRTVLASQVGQDLPSGAFGYAVGTGKVNFNDLDCTTTATRSTGIQVKIERNNGAPVGTSDIVDVATLTDEFEEFIFEVDMDNLQTDENYRLRILPVSEGNLTCDIATFVTTGYGGDPLNLNENHATYGISGADNPWTTHFNLDGTEVPYSDPLLSLMMASTAPPNTETLMQERYLAGLLYDIGVSYGEESNRYSGGEMSARAR